MDELLFQYADRFGENFPMFYARDMDDEEVSRTIQRCLDSGKPYTPDFEDGVLY